MAQINLRKEKPFVFKLKIMLRVIIECIFFENISNILTWFISFLFIVQFHVSHWVIWNLEKNRNNKFSFHIFELCILSNMNFNAVICNQKVLQTITYIIRFVTLNYILSHHWCDINQSNNPDSNHKSKSERFDWHFQPTSNSTETFVSSTLYN